ncbi:MFS transporter [Modestobacter sp. I12A-02628]|uniref:MFS transporter n=2 Tax=Goekera deserti TaxID=2497753 RepID=A0A7K3WBJ0_9ACTN|nr:MFS transporter [Goekera deserti]NDI48082.1 MFS transporter [Goekera deserti]NEL53831.1 MFS transporter [Goekera deserti]
MQALVGVGLVAFGSFSLTIASLPAHAVAEGAGVQLAGVVTTVMLVATVASQTGVPALVRRLGTGRVLAAGLLALGLPAPLYTLDAGVGWLSAVSAVRGFGFAVLTVLAFTLAAGLVQPARRGEAIGVFGVSVALPNLAAVPAGAALTLGGHFPWVAWLAAMPVLGVLLVPAVARAATVTPPGQRQGGVGTAARAAAAPSLLLLLVTVTGGGLITFLPIERPDGATATLALLVLGLGAALTRWRVGALADRAGSRVLLPAAVLVSAAGIALVAGGLVLDRGGDVVVVLGAAVFGAGNGALQNLTLLAAFARAGEGGTTAASAVWNASFDSGTAIGAVGVGVLAGAVGLPVAYVLLAVVLSAVVPVAVAAARSGPGPG